MLGIDFEMIERRREENVHVMNILYLNFKLFIGNIKKNRHDWQLLDGKGRKMKGNLSPVNPSK